MLARNLKNDSFLRTGETCAKSNFCCVKKLHEGLFSNQDAWEKARLHHAALQKQGCFDELCAVLAKRVDFSASYIDNSIIFGTAHAFLNTLLFCARSEAPDFLIKHAFIACCISSLALALPWSPRHLQSLGMVQMSSVG